MDVGEIAIGRWSELRRVRGGPRGVQCNGVADFGEVW